MKQFLLSSIKFYQKTSFFHSQILKNLFLTDSACRFEPTCSEYTYQAIEKYGSIKGVIIGLKRILRCHPFSKGGYDPLK